MPKMVQLPCAFAADTIKWLKREAKKDETSTAEIVRRAVRLYRSQKEESR